MTDRPLSGEQSTEYELDHEATKNMSWEDFRDMWFSEGEIPGGGTFTMFHSSVSMLIYELLPENVKKYYRRSK